MFRRWVPVGFITVAVSLALAGGAVLAVGGGDDGKRSDVFERAVEILGIGTAQLEAAHAQATRELNDERLASIIEKFVSSGLIEQSEADSFVAWMADRPASIDDALFSKLTALAPGALNPVSPSHSKLKLFSLVLDPGSDVISRMAEILGIGEEDLIGALQSDASDPVPDSRLSAMHSAIDDLLESGSITPDEATELHSWVDDTPQWLLDSDLSSRILPALQFRFGNRLVPGGFEGFQFILPSDSDTDSFPQSGRYFFFGDDNQKFEFDFEFRGPLGTFRFGPGAFEPGGYKLPLDSNMFSDERLRDLLDGFDIEGFGGLEGFEGLENLENLEELFKRFRGFGGHGFSIPPSTDPDGTEDPAATSFSSGTSA